ncbi:MAG: GldG family protein [Firmicutes bacterium]|nr:GldG family protein [Bacillota bacterium]
MKNIFKTEIFAVTLLIIGTVIFIDLSAGILSASFLPGIDLSDGGLYSIGPETREVLSALDKKVIIYALFDEGKSDDEYKGITALLRSYEKNSDGMISVEYTDPDKDESVLSRFDITGLAKNDFIAANGKAAEKISYSDLFNMEYDKRTGAWFTTGSKAEQAFTEAIYKLQNKNIYALSHNNTLSPTYGALWETLEKDGNAAAPLSFDNEIPDDASTVIITEQEKDITYEQYEKLSAFLEKGGNALFFFDIDTNTAPNYGKLLSDYGITGIYGGNMPEHLILDIKQSDAVLMDFYGLSLESPQTIKIEQRDGISHSVAAQDENGDIAAVTAEKENSKIAVIGDTDFISRAEQDAYPEYFGNALYFVSSITDWLDSEDISISSKSYNFGEIQIPNKKAAYIGVITIIVIPLYIVGFGFNIWRKRRYL